MESVLIIRDTIWWTFSFHWPYYTIFLLSFLLLYFYHRLSKFNWDTSKFFSFLFFSSSNFRWYQFNSYIYVNASQIHILLQIFFFFQTLIYLLVFLLHFPISLSSWLKPVTNYLLWFSISLRTLFQIPWAQTRSDFIPFSFATNPMSHKVPN